MKVLVIPEDPTNNGYILKPLVKRLLQAAGKPNAFVQVLTSPRAQGYPMVKAHLPEIAERYRHMDLILFLPDQDCQDRTEELQRMEQIVARQGAKMFACAAVQEVEAWLLAGHLEKLPDGWQTVRQECSLKERYFEPFLERYGDNSAGSGRERLMRETLRQFDGLLAHCPELAVLLERIQTTITEA